MTLKSFNYLKGQRLLHEKKLKQPYVLNRGTFVFIIVNATRLLHE